MLGSSPAHQHRNRGKAKMDRLCPWDLNQLCAGGFVVKDACIIYGPGFQQGISHVASLGSGRPTSDLCLPEKWPFRNPISHHEPLGVCKICCICSLLQEPNRLNPRFPHLMLLGPKRAVLDSARYRGTCELLWCPLCSTVHRAKGFREIDFPGSARMFGNVCLFGNMWLRCVKRLSDAGFTLMKEWLPFCYPIAGCGKDQCSVLHILALSM